MHRRLPRGARRECNRPRGIRTALRQSDAIRAPPRSPRDPRAAQTVWARARNRRELRPLAGGASGRARPGARLLGGGHAGGRGRRKACGQDLRARFGASCRCAGACPSHRRRRSGRGGCGGGRNEVRVGADSAGTRRLGLSRKLAGWFALVGAVSAISYAGRFTSGKPPKDALYQYSTAASELVLFAVILALVLWIARGLPKREAFAFRLPNSWSRAFGLGISVFVVIAIANAALNPLLHGGREQGLTPSGWEPRHAAAFGLNLFAFAIVGPIVEELTFRGLGFYLLESYGQTAAIVVIGIMFGLWHGLVEALPVLIVFGTGLAFLRSRTRSIYPGMILHATFNAAALLIAVAA